MKKKSSFFSEFKTFITRGNVLDMAVGVIVGSAFTAIVTALSNNILKPIINWILAKILGENSLDAVFTYLTKVVDPITNEIDLVKSIYIDWGAFINAIINFLLIALVLFMIVRTINKIKARQDAMKADLAMEKAAVAKYRKEGLTKKEAVAKYEADMKAEAEAKAAADAEAAAKAAAEAEAKATANTKLLEEIRDLLKNNK